MAGGIVAPVRRPLVEGHKTYHQITEDLCSPTERTPTRAWVIAFIAAVSLLAYGLYFVFVGQYGWEQVHGILIVR
jgi:hypothetical protein